ncbi:hypothetical protein [Massilia sp. CCM 8734]|uniref:hypothetical protein n=1 Tax=Massilia sp. CCM 8734 TaxID=2609283 RepID=UPI0014246F28|nr:hypothetical protein [Massilia sp. CCM 8734]NHZ98384.1 hypothetical protein [Massilia sp. CCM 8734]
MQNIKSPISLRFRLFFLMGFALLASCKDEKKPGVQDVLSTIHNNGRDSYELITIRRPTSVEEYFKLWSLPYELCVASAKLNNVPVKPFPAIPKDFVMKRTTVTSDGKSFRTTEEEFGVDIQDITVENGCATSYGSGLRTWVAHNGIEADLDSEIQSENHEGQASYQIKPYDPNLAQAYSVEKKINGIAVRCTGAHDFMVAGKVVAEMCVLDPVLGRIAMADGKPPIVYTRDIPGPSLFGSAMVDEPISLKVGIEVNPEIFVNAAAK